MIDGDGTRRSRSAGTNCRWLMAPVLARERVGGRSHYDFSVVQEARMGMDGLKVLTWDALQKTWWVGVGGFLGANARYWLGGWIQSRWGVAFPWGTFVINVTGSFLLGLFMALVTERYALPQTPTLRLVVAIGFVGGYTTFSTFEYETLSLVSTGALLRAVGNAFGSLFAGFAAVWLGVVLGRFL
jgi:CrcB protein